jgi:hypothetical protein
MKDKFDDKIEDPERRLANAYLKQFKKTISLEDRKKLSPDCIYECLYNPVIIKKFEPK